MCILAQERQDHLAAVGRFDQITLGSGRYLVRASARGHVRLPLPFDPCEVGGSKPRHSVAYTMHGTLFEGSVCFLRGSAFVVLNAAFRVAAVKPGATVDVALTPRAE